MDTKQMAWFSVSILLALAMTGLAIAGEAGVVTLKDGSVIKGDILSIGNGYLQLKSGTLGTLKIRESRIDTIRFGGGPPAERPAASPAGNDMDARIQTLQQMMSNSPQIMELLEQLKTDPDFTNAMKDKELMKLMNAGDIQGLISSPAFMKLLGNSSVQSIQKMLGQ